MPAPSVYGNNVYRPQRLLHDGTKVRNSVATCQQHRSTPQTYHTRGANPHRLAQQVDSSAAIYALTC